VIVRILGEGQLDLTDDAVAALNDLDAKVESAIEAGDEAAFHGVPHGADALDPSDLILPMADATLAEVRDMLSGDGLIPG
jgi:hypothetical protein